MERGRVKREPYCSVTELVCFKQQEDEVRPKYIRK